MLGHHHDIEEVEVLAMQHHADFEAAIGQHLEHTCPREVVRRLKKLVDVYMTDKLGDVAFSFRGEISRAAWFVYAMDLYGMDYESVAAEIGTTPATIVAQLSMDMRLPRPQRCKFLRSQLAGGSDAVRLVRLAELWAMCDHFLAQRDNQDLRDILTEWLPEAEQWLGANPLSRRTGASSLYKAAKRVRRLLIELNVTFLSGRRKKPDTGKKPTKTKQTKRPTQHGYGGVMSSLAG